MSTSDTPLGREAGSPTAGGERSWLTVNVKALSGVSLLQDSASELLYPILPIFLTVTLGAPAVVVGIVEGAAEGVAALAKLLAGRLSDRYGRKGLIALGYGLAAIGKVLVAIAVVWPAVLAGRCVDRLGKGVRGAPRDALLMVGADPAARGRIFGFHRAADTIGAVIGPALGLLLYELLGHRIRPLLLIAVIPAVLSVLLVAAVHDDNPRRHDKTALSGQRVARPGQLAPQLGRLIVIVTAFSLVNFPDALLLRAHALGLSTAGVFGAYIALNVVYAAASYPAGALSDRLPRHLVFAAGLGLFAVGYLGLGLIHTPGWVFVLLPLYGGFAACTDGVGKAWIASLAPDSGQGSAQGLYQGAIGGAVLVAGLWAGLAWNGDGHLPLLIAGTVGVVAALAMALVGNRLDTNRLAAYGITASAVVVLVHQHHQHLVPARLRARPRDARAGPGGAHPDRAGGDPARSDPTTAQLGGADLPPDPVHPDAARWSLRRPRGTRPARQGPAGVLRRPALI